MGVLESQLGAEVLKGTGTPARGQRGNIIAWLNLGKLRGNPRNSLYIYIIYLLFYYFYFIFKLCHGFSITAVVAFEGHIQNPIKR